MDLVNIAAFDVYRYSLKLNQALSLNGRNFEQRNGFIIHLKSDRGADGFGDIAPLPGVSKETLDESKTQIQALRASLCGQPISERFAALNGQLDTWLNGSSLYPSVRFGLESAILNLIANTKNIPLYKLIAKTNPAKIKITGLLSGSEDQIAAQAQGLIAAGFTELKLKVGKDLEQAIAKVRKVNDIIYGKALLHVDANRAWTFDRALEFGKEIGCDAVNYIEEPFKDIEKIPEFFDETLIPVALDESVAQMAFDDIKSIPGVDILVLKPTLLGGIEKTFQIIRRSEDLALDTVISSAFESSVGIVTLANLAGTVSHHSVAAGLDTFKWFADDTMRTTPRIEKGSMDIRACSIRSEDIKFSALQKIR